MEKINLSEKEEQEIKDIPNSTKWWGYFFE